MAEVAPYVVLLQLFVDGSITADELEAIFLKLYKSDMTDWSPEVFNLLDSFFADLDSYCGDKELRNKVDGLDEFALKESAQITSNRLRVV